MSIDPEDNPELVEGDEMTLEEAVAAYDAALDDPEDDNTGQGDDSDRVAGGDADE